MFARFSAGYHKRGIPLEGSDVWAATCDSCVLKDFDAEGHGYMDIKFWLALASLYCPYKKVESAQIFFKMI